MCRTAEYAKFTLEPRAARTRGLFGPDHRLPVPAPIIAARDRAVVERVMVDVAILGVEAVIARIGAAIEPGPMGPRGPDMADVMPRDHAEIGRAGRSRYAGKHCRAKRGHENPPLGAEAKTESHVQPPSQIPDFPISLSRRRDGKSKRRGWLSSLDSVVDLSS